MLPLGSMWEPAIFRLEKPETSGQGKHRGHIPGARLIDVDGVDSDIGGLDVFRAVPVGQGAQLPAFLGTLRLSPGVSSDHCFLRYPQLLQNLVGNFASHFLARLLRDICI